MTAILIGLAVTIVAEAVTWLGKKLSGTVLQSYAAFFVAALITLVAAVLKVGLPTSWESFKVLSVYFGQVFTVSQGLFWIVVKTLNLNVQPDVVPTVTAPTTQ